MKPINTGNTMKDLILTHRKAEEFEAKNACLIKIATDTLTLNSELIEKLKRSLVIIARLKEDAETLCDIADNFGDDAVAVLKHRALMKKLEC